MLELLRERGLKVGLISNCSEEEVISFGQSGLAPYFDDVIFSYEVGVAKPNPEIYRMACDRLGVTPQESLFIGDGGSDELRGASNAGLRPFHAYWFNTFIESEYEKIHQPRKCWILSNLLLKGVAGAMKLQAINHLCFSVSELERSIAFIGTYLKPNCWLKGESWLILI